MALTERVQNTNQVGFWTGEIPLEYIYTYGRAGEAYFRTLKDKGTFTGTRCHRCGITYVPPRIYCERCFDRLESDYVSVGTVGEVHTFTLLCKNLDGTSKREPSILAVIRLDGTDGGIVHYLDGVRPEDVCIGMKVKAVLKPKKERTGEIHDIICFKPLKTT